MVAVDEHKNVLAHQAVASPTFQLPPDLLACKRPLPALWDWHLDHSPAHPLFVYHEDGQEKTISIEQAVRAVHRAGHFAVANIKKDSGSAHLPVVGVLAIADSLTFWPVILGLMHAGFVPLLISPRNSAQAVAHLLASAKSATIIASTDAGVQTLVTDALSYLSTGEQAKKMTVLNLPAYAELYKEDDAFVRLPEFKVNDINDPAIICHSSGSTSFPKLIALSHKWIAQRPLCKFSTKDVCSSRFGVHSFPLFHAAGVILQIVFPASSGITLSVYPPRTPPIVSTPDKMFDAVMATKCDFLMCVPSFAEEWSRDEEKIKALSQLKSVLVGSGPTRRDVGDKLVKYGVNFQNTYGSTEYGFAGILSDEFLGENWEYFRFPPVASIHWRPQHGEKDKFEMVFVATEEIGPAYTNTTVDGKPAYATSDILERHPEDPTLWRVIGRTDDQIMHSTGEKTNPGPLEAIITIHPSVHSCVMFGRGKFQTGVLVEPVRGKEFDPEDAGKLAEFRNEIWPAVEKANEYAPKHSRIFKEMIIVTDPCRPFQRTPKGTIRRKLVLEDYADEIEAAYTAVEDAANKDILVPVDWDESECLGFVRKLVCSALEKEVDDDEDVFQSGADSLRATAIRSSIMFAFRKADKPTTDLEQNLVYAHPTITSLAKFIHGTANGHAQLEASPESKIAEMEALIAEFTQEFAAHRPSRSMPDTEGVLVTGTTGSLGTHILAALLAGDKIGHVFALNRPDRKGGKLVMERQCEAFMQHGRNPEILKSEKLVLLEGDTGAPQLGLSDESFKDLRESITSIIHNAWRVDFNIPLSSFKPLIRGVRNLIDLSLSSPFSTPPTMVFTSSIGTIMGWKESRPVPEEIITDPTVALGNGYGESKWVAQRILDAARERTRMHTVVVRVGQMCGNTINGNWNRWEWFPAMVQSYSVAGCLPNDKGLASWVPADIAGSAIAELRNSRAPILHLVHPKPVRWTDLMTPLADALHVPLVPYNEWLAKMEDALNRLTPEEAANVPALKLIDFYRHVDIVEDADSGRDAFIAMKVEVGKMTKESAVMGSDGLPRLSVLDAMKWMQYWRNVGAL